MRKLLKQLSIALISGLLAFSLLAAEAELENQPQEISENQQPDGNTVAADDSALDSESNSGDAAEEDSPSRFIPTEQISQDLGVSFPADI